MTLRITVALANNKKDYFNKTWKGNVIFWKDQIWIGLWSPLEVTGVTWSITVIILSITRYRFFSSSMLSVLTYTLSKNRLPGSYWMPREQGCFNNIISHRAKQYTGVHIYTTNHWNKTVNVVKIKHIFIVMGLPAKISVWTLKKYAVHNI